MGGRATPIELIGGVHFPPIGELPYLLTLAGHGFYWFRLTAPPEEATAPMTDEIHTETTATSAPDGRRHAGRLPRAARWFAGKGRDPR